MDINTLLTELVIIADTLDGTSPDIGADVDAAIFIMSEGSALPRNKSLASIVRENYEKVSSLEEAEIEKLAIAAATKIAELTNEVLSQTNSAYITAILGSLAQSLSSVLHPNGVLSSEAAKKGSEFLLNAEKKLSQQEPLYAIGYRVGLVRSEIEKHNG